MFQFSDLSISIIHDILWRKIVKHKMKLLKLFLNAVSKDASAYYHWTLKIEIIGHTEIIMEY